MADLTAAQRRAQRALCREINHFRQRFADAGLWKTYHAMDEVVKTLGWEVAEQREPTDG